MNASDEDDDYDEYRYDTNNNKIGFVDDYAEDEDYQKARRRTRSSPFFRKHEKLHRALAEVVEDFGLLSFIPLDISSAESVGRVVARIDKCNGYMFLASQNSNPHTHNLFEVAAKSEPSIYETIADIQERLIDAKEYKRKEQSKT